jgi:hypothetical protein
MEGHRKSVLIAADQYQFLDTVFGTTAATRQEWQVANSLERLRELAAPTPLAIVVDLEASCFSYTQVLSLLGSMRIDAPIILLAGVDIDQPEQAKQLAKSLSLDVTGTLRRPLIMTALLRLLKSHAVPSTATAQD